MADEDKKLVLGVGVEGAPQAAAAMKDVETAATRTGEAVGNTAKESNRAADAGDNMTLGLTHQAREMQHAEDAGRALSDIMSGRLAPAAIDATRGFAGFTALLAENPFMLAVIGIPVVIEAIKKLSDMMDDGGENVKKREEEMAKNTEQMSKRMEEALKKPADAEAFITLLENFQKELDLLHKLQSAYDAVTDAKEKYAAAIREQNIAQLKSDEEKAILTAKSAGRSPEEIEAIKAGYDTQITAAENEQSTGTAAGKTAEAKQKLDERHSDLEKNEKERADIAAKIAADDAVREQALAASQADYLQKLADLEKKESELKARKAAAEADIDPDTAQAAGPVFDPQIEGVEQERKQATAQFENTQKITRFQMSPPIEEQKKKMAALETDYEVLQQQVKQLEIEFQTAQVKEGTVGIEAGTKTAEQFDKNADATAKATTAAAKKEREREAASIGTEAIAAEKLFSGLDFPRDKPTQEKGESQAAFAKRLQDYISIKEKVQSTLERAEHNKGGSSEELRQIHDLLDRLMTVVDKSHRNHLDLTIANFDDLARRIETIEQQVENNRVP